MEKQDFHIELWHETKPSDAFISGMGNVLGLGGKPTLRNYCDNTQQALAHDFGMLWNDLLAVLVEVIKKLPPEKREQLKMFILNYEPDDDDMLVIPLLLRTHQQEKWMNPVKRTKKDKSKIAQ